jgi:hypothetical protein
MNAFFDLNRWFLYMNKHWNENKRKYLLSLGALTALGAIWFTFIMVVNRRNPLAIEMQVATYYVGLIVTGCLFASQAFADLADGPKAIHFFLLPVSVFEKLLTAIVLGLVLYFIGYTLIFYGVDVIMVKIANGILENKARHDAGFVHIEQKVANVLVAPASAGMGNFYIYFIMAYVAAHAVFLLGSVYFIKYNFIKTAVALLAIFITLAVYNDKIIGAFMPHGEFYEPFSIYRIYQNGTSVAVQLPKWLGNSLFYIMEYALAPLFWVITYIRLKEKEV